MKKNSQKCPYCRFIGDHIMIAVVKGKTFTQQCKNCGKQFCSLESDSYRLWEQFIKVQGKPDEPNFIREISE